MNEKQEKRVLKFVKFHKEFANYCLYLGFIGIPTAVILTDLPLPFKILILSTGSIIFGMAWGYAIEEYRKDKLS